MILKKIIYLGSKPIGYECLEWMIGQREELHFEITGVLTQSRREFGGAHVLEALAAKHGIPLIDHPDNIPACDILYSVQYHRILNQQHIAKARQIAVNLHMAPLPEYRGSNQFSFAILDNKTEFGTTIHQIDTRIDHGSILFQERFPIPGDCWVHDLYELTRSASARLFKNTLPKIVANDYDPVPQEELVALYGTSLHFRNEMDQLKIIELGWDKERTERYIRATSMPGFEPPYCLIDGRKVYFTVEPPQ